MVRGSRTPANVMRTIRKAARSTGYTIEIRQGKGSHEAWCVYDGDRLITYAVIPQHPGDLAKGTLESIQDAFESAFGKGWLDK